MLGLNELPRDAKNRVKESKIFDLSAAAATDEIVLDMNCPVVIDRVDAFYVTEDASANAGVHVKVGTVTPAGVLTDNSIADYTSEVSIVRGTTKPVTLLTTLRVAGATPADKPIVPAGTSIRFSSAGGKTGAGELRMVVTFHPFRQVSEKSF